MVIQRILLVMLILSAGTVSGMILQSFSAEGTVQVASLR